MDLTEDERRKLEAVHQAIDEAMGSFDGPPVTDYTLADITRRISEVLEHVAPDRHAEAMAQVRVEPCPSDARKVRISMPHWAAEMLGLAPVKPVAVAIEFGFNFGDEDYTHPPK